MNVQEIKIEGKKRYMLIDNNGIPVIPVVRYIKHLDHIEKSYNTQKTYCYALKLFFEYLDEVNIDYKEITFDTLSKFISWLRNPYQSTNIVAMSPSKSKRAERTVNLIITAVVKFYDYLYRNEEIDSDMVEKTLSKVYTNGHTNYKNFLYHINKNAPLKKNILKLKEPRRRVKTLSQEEVNIIYAATSNIRDKLLIKLLFETGLRIGEALSLYLEDFIYDHKNGHYIQLTNRGELPNGAKLKTGERKLEVSQELMDLFDDYAYEVLDELEIDTNFVFVKITGPNKGEPLDYIAVSSLFKRLKHKTGIDVHAHLFRHTHATIYYNQTKDIKQVQERLGHTQIQTTMNIYVHPSEEEKRANWEVAQPAFKINKGDNTNE
ncbi:MAG: transposase [Cellulosilyticum sp.]|nr:transposase [Cellulosilyticum sp.]